MTLRDKLLSLYPKDGEKLFSQVQKLIGDGKPKKNKPDAEPKPNFCEKDVILIAYADHVWEKNIKPLKTVKRFLDEYAAGLINRVHFLPFYPYSSDDGFSVVDYYRVNPAYGDWDDIQAIGKNFQLMFDCVANHCSAQSEWFRKFLLGGGYYSRFFIAFDQDQDLSRVFRPRTSPLLSEFETRKGKKYVWTTFSPDQIDLDFSQPEVFLEMAKILLFYLENGARAIRLDAIAYAWKRAGTACFDLPEVHLLVQALRDVVKAVSPETWIITETVLPHQENIRYFGNGRNEADLVYNFVLETLLLHLFLKKDSGQAIDWINSQNQLGPDNAMLNLSVSHDGIHVIPAKSVLSAEEIEAIGEDCAAKGGQVLKRSTPKGEEPYEFNITYPSALGDARAFLASQAIQLALKGVPLIYLNNLIGADNWNEGVEKLGYSRAINREKFNYPDLKAELDTPGSRKNTIYTGYQRLLKARTSEPLFSPQADQAALPLDPRVLAIRRWRGQRRLLALTNLTDSKLKLDSRPIKEALDKPAAIDILSNKNYNLSKPIELEPFNVLWLK